MARDSAAELNARLHYQQFKAQLAGNVDLSNNYPLDLQLKLATDDVLMDPKQPAIPLDVVVNAKW